MNAGIDNAPPPRSHSKSPRLERLLAGLLHYGTWLASAVVAAGLLLLAAHRASAGMRIVQAGVALFILLPVTRVAVMLAAFLRARDFLYVLIAALVLAIIAAGLLLGMHPPAHR